MKRVINLSAITIFISILLFLPVFPIFAANVEHIADKLTKTTSSDQEFKFERNHKNIYASNNLRGNGAENASVYDMSITETSLYRSYKVLNGNMFFTNSTYPMVNASALTSETFLNLTYNGKNGLKSGISALVYTNADSDYPEGNGVSSQRMSRVFGVPQPLGNWTSITQNSNGISSTSVPHFYLGLWNLFVSQETESSKWKLEAGNLQLNMGRDTNKYLDTNTILFRTPINQMSLLGHLTRQDINFAEFGFRQRIPGYGIKLSGNTNKINYEIFNLKNDETAITLGTDYHYYGLRAGFANENERIALSAISSQQNLFGNAAKSGINKKSEDLLSLEYERDINENLSAYGFFSISNYNEYGSIERNFKGNAYLAGIQYKLLKEKFTIGIKYQHLDPNYEPLGHHKNPVYIYNYKGFKTEAKYSWTGEKNKNFISLSYCDFSQVNPFINESDFAKSDYIFPDLEPYLTSSAGKIKILSPEFNLHFEKQGISLGGYYEKLKLSKSLDNSFYSYDRQVDNYSVWGHIDLNKQLKTIIGYREVNFSGQWLDKNKSYNHSQKVTIPKIGLSYNNDKDVKISAQVNFYNFQDISAKALNSDNDWKSTLFLLETKFNF